MEGKTNFNGRCDRKEKGQQLDSHDVKEGCVAGIETMCSQHIKKQSKGKKPVV